MPYTELYSTSDSRTFIREIDEFVGREYKDQVPWDGVFAATDRYAEYMMDALTEHGSPAVVGETLQIIGFDGITSHANEKIRISSMRQPVEAIAAMRWIPFAG